MEILQTIFFTLIALGVLVTIHEYGHFWVARRTGTKVIRFSIGFGTALWRKTDRQGTEFVIAALPLGGYVKMVDEREGDVDQADLPYAFNRKTVWQRMAVVAAGPLANFLLAIVLFWIIFLTGVQGLAPIVGNVSEGSIAAQAGLQANDEIVAVDGKTTVTTQDVREQLIYRIGETGTLTLNVRPQGSTNEYAVDLKLQRWLADAEEIDPVEGLGFEFYRPEIVPVAEQIERGSPAEQAGLLSGDRVLRADNQEIADWSTWVDYVRQRAGQRIDIVVLRDDQEVPLSVTPKSVTLEDGSVIGQVGMSVLIPEWPEEYLRTVNYGVFAAFLEAVDKTWDTSVMILDSIGKMLEGLISAKHLSGPITIAKVAGTSAQYGIVPFLSFLAFLSVSLGVLNLLPIPVLDGGHLLYYLVEAIKGSPVSMKIQEAGFRFGMVVIVGLMVIALYNDLTRL